VYTDTWRGCAFFVDANAIGIGIGEMDPSYVSVQNGLERKSTLLDSVGVDPYFELIYLIS